MPRLLSETNGASEKLILEKVDTEDVIIEKNGYSNGDLAKSDLELDAVSDFENILDLINPFGKFRNSIRTNNLLPFRSLAENSHFLRHICRRLAVCPPSNFYRDKNPALLQRTGSIRRGFCKLDYTGKTRIQHSEQTERCRARNRPGISAVPILQHGLFAVSGNELSGSGCGEGRRAEQRGKLSRRFWLDI